MRIEAATLRPPDAGVDLTEQNLLLCACIAKAQAQFCAYDRVKRRAPGKYTMLSRLAMQASVFYGKAYSVSSAEIMWKTADARTYAPVLHFNECAFAAQAHYWVAMEYLNITEETMHGIGYAVAHIHKAHEYVAAVRRSETSLPPVLAAQCDDLMKQYVEKEELLVDQNKRIYHEEIPQRVEEVECLQFSQPFSIDEELSLPFEGRDVLAKLVPRAVRVLAEEYRARVEAVIAQSFQMVNQCDSLQEKYLAQFGLPSTLHAAFGEQRLPEDVWEKVKQCKEKGGMKIVDYLFSCQANFNENAESALVEMCKRVQTEEDEDEELREQYGPTWRRLPSQNLNRGLNVQLQYYMQKLVMCRMADRRLKDLLRSKQEYLELIQLDRADIVANIPKSSHAERKPSFAASKLTELMKSLGELKMNGQLTLERMMKTLENDSVVNELFRIYQGLKEKTKVWFTHVTRPVDVPGAGGEVRGDAEDPRGHDKEETRGAGSDR